MGSPRMVSSAAITLSSFPRTGQSGLRLHWELSAPARWSYPWMSSLGTKLSFTFCAIATRAVITTQKRVERIEKLASSEKKPKLILFDADSDDKRSWERFLDN